MTDFADFTEDQITIVSELAAGNGAPLADHLAKGGELNKFQRAMLIKYLRKELVLKRGNRRTFAEGQRVEAIRFALQSLQMRLAIEQGSRGSYGKALEVYGERHPEIGHETLRKYAKHGLLPRSWLDAIDQARSEAGLG